MNETDGICYCNTQSPIKIGDNLVCNYCGGDIKELKEKKKKKSKKAVATPANS